MNPRKLDAWNIASSGAVVAHVAYSKGVGSRINDPDLKLLDKVIGGFEVRAHAAGY